jgi:hypothetical protein
MAAVLLLAFAFFDFIHTQTPAPLGKNSAPLIGMWGFWRFVTRLPLPVPRTAAAVVLTVGVATIAAFVAYAGAIALVWRRRATRRTLLAVAGPAVAFFAMSTLALPTSTVDIYDYILIGRLVAVHDRDPFTTAPDRFPDDPMYRYSQDIWTHQPDTKGPIFVGPAAAWAALGGDSPVRSVMAFRLGFLAFNLGALALIVLVLQRSRPDHALAGAVLYGWSPIVVTLGQERADTIMVFFLVAGIGLLLPGRRVASALAVAASAIVKLITLPLLGAHFLRELLERRWRSLIVGGVLAMAFAVLVYLPFTSDFGAPLELLGESGRAGCRAMSPEGCTESASTSGLPGGLALVLRLAVIALVVWAAMIGRRGDDEFIRAWTVVALFMAAFLYPVNSSAYLMTSIALAALTGDRVLTALTTALSFVSFTFNRGAKSAGPGFPLPDIEQIAPRPVLFLGMLTLVVAGMAALLFWRRSHQLAAARLPNANS